MSEECFLHKYIESGSIDVCNFFKWKYIRIKLNYVITDWSSYNEFIKQIYRIRSLVGVLYKRYIEV